MEIRTLDCLGDDPAVPGNHEHAPLASGRWRWVDIQVGSDDGDELVTFANTLQLDALSVRQAVDDAELPKVDDLGSSLHVVLHGLAEHRVETYEVDCFLTDRVLVTVRRSSSPAIEALWTAAQMRSEVTSGGTDELLARVADVMTRRLVSVLDVFDERTEGLITLALRADGQLLGEVTAIRADLATVRRSVQPLREMFDVLRRSTSPLITDSGRRRFSNVFDVASRSASGIDAARTALTETLDAYRGAEARQATEVTKVLTIYAAIMLPLALVVGFFGMNFENLPGTRNDNAWIIVTVCMLVGTAISLGVFVALGWIRRPSGRAAGSTLGRGLIESARAPAQLVGAAFEISIMPLRTVASMSRRLNPDELEPGDD